MTKSIEPAGWRPNQSTLTSSFSSGGVSDFLGGGHQANILMPWRGQSVGKGSELETRRSWF